MIHDIQIGGHTQSLKNVPSKRLKTQRARVVNKSLCSKNQAVESLKEVDQNAIFGILGQLASSQNTLAEKKHEAFNKVNELVAADVWLWGRVKDGELVESSVMTNYEDGGNITQYTQVMLSSHLFQLYLLQEVSDHRTLVINEGGPFSCIYSIRAMEDGTTSLFVSFRTEVNEDFSQNDVLVLNTILKHLPLMHELQTDPKEKALTPKMQLVLRALKDGLSRKQIADQLQISVNTVSAYVRDIYREYQVHSHAELIRYFKSLA